MWVYATQAKRAHQMNRWLEVRPKCAMHLLEVGPLSKMWGPAGLTDGDYTLRLGHTITRFERIYTATLSVFYHSEAIRISEQYLMQGSMVCGCYG